MTRFKWTKPPNRTCSGGATVTQRQAIDDSSGISDHHPECIKFGWVATCQKSHAEGPWNREERRAHQLARTKSCLSSLENLCLKLAQYSYIAPDRQCYCNFFYQPQRRDSLVKPSTEDLGLEPSEEYHHFRRVHSWSEQRRSRQGIEKANWSCRVDVQNSRNSSRSVALWRWISSQPGTITNSRDTTVTGQTQERKLSMP